MKVAFIRHSLTDSNTQRRYLGSTDEPINDEGRARLKLFKDAKVYPDPTGRKFYSSGLLRTQQTLEAIYGNVPYEKMPAFNEVAFGIFETKYFDELVNDPAYIEWKSGDHLAKIPPGGESYYQMMDRAYPALMKLVENEPEDKIIVTHGGVIIGLMMKLFEEPGKGYYDWRPYHCGGYEVTFENGKPVSYTEIGKGIDVPDYSARKKVIVATGNKDKAREFGEILPNTKIVTMRDAGFEGDIEENGSTFAENAYIKAKTVWDKTGGLVLADDSGLSIDALGGEPGIYSARYLGEDTPYQKKNEIVIGRMKNVVGPARSARFTCVICAIFPDGDVKYTEGTMEGVIAEAPAGDNGFGYDPILFIPELGKTSAELDAVEKNMISHRGKALRKMSDVIKEKEGK